MIREPMQPRLSAGQVFQMAAELLRESEESTAMLRMGPFDKPLSAEQREGIDGFVRDALDQALTLVHLHDDRREIAVAVITNGRA